MGNGADQAAKVWKDVDAVKYERLLIVNGEYKRQAVEYAHKLDQIRQIAENMIPCNDRNAILRLVGVE